MCVSPFIYSWILDVLTDRHQSLKFGQSQALYTYTEHGHSTGLCVAFFPFTHDCLPLHNSNIIIKYADDTMVVGHFTNSDESAHQHGVSPTTSP